MPAPDVFIGLVSHAKSRFAWSQGSQGLSQALSSELRSRGIVVEVKINVENLHDPKVLVLRPHMSVDSMTGELAMEERWHEFLGKKNHIRFKVRMFARHLRITVSRIRRKQVADVERLLNIEYSHIDLMKSGLISGAPWILILEDDASSKNMGTLGDLIAFFMDTEKPPKMVNLSKSFTTRELGIDHLLHKYGPAVLNVFRSDLPVTNTVCATIYQQSFLAELVRELEAVPPEPIIPIDWRVNEALMRMWDRGLIGVGDCWLVDPAPIVQLSMHDPVTQPDIMTE